MRHGPLFVTALRMAFAVAALLPVIAVGQGGLALPAFTAKGWIALIFLGATAGAVQFLPFMWGLRWLPPTTTVLYLTLNPIADELLAGMAFALMGIAVGSSAYADLRKARASLSG